MGCRHDLECYIIGHMFIALAYGITHWVFLIGNPIIGHYQWFNESTRPYTQVLSNFRQYHLLSRISKVLSASFSCDWNSVPETTMSSDVLNIAISE